MIAPFLTPTQITAGFTEKWRERSLEENSTERVAEAIAFVALDERRSGEGLLVSLVCPSLIDRFLIITNPMGCSYWNLYIERFL